MMFDQLFKRPFYVQKHLNAPLLEERINYIQSYAVRGRSSQTLKDIAQYLWRVIEFLHLETGAIVTIEEIESAADKWARITLKKESLTRKIPGFVLFTMQQAG